MKNATITQRQAQNNGWVIFQLGGGAWTASNPKRLIAADRGEENPQHAAVDSAFSRATILRRIAAIEKQRSK
jgi:hypothetical protein